MNKHNTKTLNLFIGLLLIVCPLTITHAQSASTLKLSRAALQFENEQLTRIVEQNKTVSIQAVINHSGAGTFEAIWEVATPASTKGDPIYQTLTAIQQHLAGNNQRTVFQSPVLPSNSLGLYLVRLRIKKPNVEFEHPVLRYMVNSARQTNAKNSRINLLTPSRYTHLKPSTRFTWQTYSEAFAYQLEIYEQLLGNEPQINMQRIKSASQAIVQRANTKLNFTGILVPKDQTSIKLPPNTLTFFESGKNYYWRVLAFSEEGKILAYSPMREIIMP